MRGDAGNACQAVARISKWFCVTARIDMLCHSIVAPSLLTVYELFTKCHENGTRVSSWQVATPRKFFWTFHDMIRTISPDARPHAIHTHIVTSSSLSGTPDCVPWRKPFKRTLCCASVRLASRAADASPWLRATKTARLGTPISGHCWNKIRARMRLRWGFCCHGYNDKLRRRWKRLQRTRWGAKTAVSDIDTAW